MSIHGVRDMAACQGAISAIRSEALHGAARAALEPA